MAQKKRSRPARTPLDVDAVLAQGDADRAAAQRRHNQEARQRSGYGGFDSYYGYGYARPAVSRAEDEPATLVRRPAVQGSGRYKSARERKAAKAQQTARQKNQARGGGKKATAKRAS